MRRSACILGDVIGSDGPRGTAGPAHFIAGSLHATSQTIQLITQPLLTRFAPLLSGIMSQSARVPRPVNEPVKSYAPGSPERVELKARLAAMAGERPDIPLVIGGERVRSGDVTHAVMPHDHHHVLADWHQARQQDVEQAIEAAGEAHREWSTWSQQERSAVFLKAAELLATTDRATANAARTTKRKMPQRGMRCLETRPAFTRLGS